MRAHRQSWLCRAGVFHGECIPRSYPAGGAANTLLTGTAWQGLGSCRFDTRAPGAIPCEHPVLPKNYVCCDSGLSLSHTASLSPWVHLLWRKTSAKLRYMHLKKTMILKTSAILGREKNHKLHIFLILENFVLLKWFSS